MSDTGKPELQTGGRDDLVVDPSRCLCMRFSESNCRSCAAACPHGAIALNGALTLDSAKCTGCLACTVACPTGALEPAKGFSSCLVQLSRVAEPVLGCIRTRDASHAAIACLGGLSEEHLVGLHAFVPGKITLNLTACSGCPNGGTIAALRQRMDDLRACGLIDARMLTADASDLLCCQEETVGRRGFFKSLRNSLFRSAALAVGCTDGRTGQQVQTPYGEKRLPARRVLLNEARESMSQRDRGRITLRFDWQVCFTEGCTGCNGCAATCPTGALKRGDPDTVPGFDSLLCTGCGLCREFCLDHALQLSKAP